MDDPVVLQETNNVVVWLRPAPVVAKVAVRSGKDDDLRREHLLATELVSLNSSVAKPLFVPTIDAQSGHLVTMWEHIDPSSDVAVRPEELAASLHHLHERLGGTAARMPSFRQDLLLAQATLSDLSRTGSLADNDRSFLLGVFSESLNLLNDHRVINERRLHGEPHEGNRIVTSTGIRWIDFEGCCVGPIEWDLAFVPADVADCYGDFDPTLLSLLRRLNSARVATWCSAAARFPIMREHGKVHLSILRGESG